MDVGAAAATTEDGERERKRERERVCGLRDKQKFTQKRRGKHDRGREANKKGACK